MRDILLSMVKLVRNYLSEDTLDLASYYWFISCLFSKKELAGERAIWILREVPEVSQTIFYQFMRTPRLDVQIECSYIILNMAMNFSIEEIFSLNENHFMQIILNKINACYPHETVLQNLLLVTNEILFNKKDDYFLIDDFKALGGVNTLSALTLH